MSKLIDKIKDIDLEITIFFTVLTLLTAVSICFLIISAYTKDGKTIQDTAIVYQKEYIPNTEHISTGTGFTSNGKMVFTSTMLGEEEKFIILIKTHNGEILTLDNKKSYSELNINDSINVQYKEVLGFKDKFKGHEVIKISKL